MSDDGGWEATPAFTVSASLGEVSVHVAEHPEGDAPGLLLLHANPGDSLDFAAVAPTLCREWTVASVDWPGYGRSTAPHPGRVTAEGLVGVAEDVLDALAARGIRQLSVIGNSVGGYVAARLAQRRPDTITSAVLVDPGGFTPRNAITRIFCRKIMGNPRIARVLVAPLARLYLGRLRTVSARATYARARQLRRNPQRLDVHCALWRSFTDPQFDLASGSATLSPTMLVWGRRDPVVPAAIDGRRARRALPHAETILLATGHEPFNEQPGEFLEHVVPFLRQHTASTSGASDSTR